MKIMVDYDGTYTADPEMWRKIIYFMACRYEVYIVTSRDPADLVEDHLWFEQHGPIPVIYCDYKAKRQVCEQQGIAIDIWIDNQPYFIDHGYPEEEAKKWRVV